MIGQLVVSHTNPMSTTTSALKPCGYCGAIHTSMCPRVVAIEYHPNGTIKRVELKP